jgi:dihydrofolate reductase
MTIALIAAMGRNRVIGRAGALPWRLPADLRHFRALTIGKPVLMGRKTFESIGKPLPGRTNIVVTRRFGFHADGCHVFSDLDKAFEAFRGAPELMVIGGASIYGQALPRATRIYLTVIDADFDGDTFFPEYDAANWTISSQCDHRADDSNAYDYSFRVLDRRAPRAG